MKNYKLIREIGSGNFATVWLAENSQGLECVLKHYNEDRIAEARREYLYLSAARGANVPEAHRFFRDEEGVWLEMEYISGDNPEIRDFKKSEDFKRWFHRLAQQVFHIHGLGICLNDIKPENIITRDGEPYLLDFGLATPNNYNDGIFRGSIAYASPEKYLLKSCHFQGDIFSLGLLFVTLLEREHPSMKLKGINWQDILSDKGVWQNWLREKDLPEELEMMLSWSAEERYNDLEAGRFFAQLSGEELRPGNSLIDSYSFKFQRSAARKIWEEKKLLLNVGDEPERIAEFAQLFGESQQRKVIMIREEELLEEPERLLERLNLLLEKSLGDISELLRIDLGETFLLLLKKTPQLEISFFEELSEKDNVFYLKTSGQVSAALVRKKEMEYFHDLLGVISIADDFKPLSIAAARLRARSKLRPETDIKRSEFLEFCNWLDCYIPLELAAVWTDSWVEELTLGIRNNFITVSGNKFLVKLAEKRVVSEELQEEFLQKALMGKFYDIAGKMYLKKNDIERAKEFYFRQYRLLIKRGFLVTAWQTLSELDQYINWEELGFSLQKARAYLMRRLGNAEGALELYSQIAVPAGSESEAVIMTDQAIAELELGHLEEAAAAYEKALEFFRDAGREKAELRCLNNLAAVYYEQKNYNRCSALYQEIIGITETKGEFDYARNYNLVAQINLADVFLHKGHWKRAHIYGRNAISAAQKMKMPLYGVQAEMIAIFALFAQDGLEENGKGLSELNRNEIFNENPAFAYEMQSLLLPVMQFYNREEEIYNKLISADVKRQNLSDNTLLSLFYVSWQHRNGKQQLEIGKNIKNTFLKNLIKALYEADCRKIVNNLGELSRQDDTLLYINYGYQLALAGYFKDEKIKKELEKILELHSFYPLEKLLKPEPAGTPEHLSLLWEIVSMIHNKVEFNEIIGEVLQGVIKIGGLDRALFYEYQEGKLKAEEGFDSNGNVLESDKVMVSETILLETLNGNEIRFFTGLQESGDIDIHSSIFGLGLRTAVCYPLRFGSKIRGVIYSDARSEKVFSTDDKKLLESVLMQGRIAFEKLFHWQKMQEQQVANLILTDPAIGGELVGSSRQMQRIYQLVGTVAEHNVNVLITGETGTGKELIARAIHRNYAPEKPFIPVNCVAIPEALLESELFGYVKGAFTGADRNREGLISAARGGTLFLDEIGDMPMSLQAKLLRVLQERRLTPLGSNNQEEVEVRILAATHHDLEKAIDEGNFRQDLYYRLKVIKIDIPPLRKRREDIPQLVNHFINKFNERFGKEVKGISSQGLGFLQHREFPGNVRELENEIERAMVLCRSNELTLDLFEKSSARSGFTIYDNIPLNWEDYRKYRQRLINDLNQVYARRLLKSSKGNVTVAAKKGNIGRTQLYRLLNKQ